MRNIDKFRGCLIGGAAGDALGYAVEFKREDEIFSEYGKDGITEYDLILDDDVAEISDDTQMTLFTAEGMLLAGNSTDNTGYISCIREMYQCWYQTQSEKYPAQGTNHCSQLMRVPELFHRRCPGTTCMTEIKAGANGTVEVPIRELQKFIQSQPSAITEFDEALVKKLLEKVTIHDDYLEFRFKSGVTISIEM